MSSNIIDEPNSFLSIALNKNVLVKSRENKVLKGVLNAFDEHLNLFLSNTTEEDTINNNIRKLGSIFLRGDMVVLISIA